MTVLARCWKPSEIVMIELTRVTLCFLPSGLDLNATRNRHPIRLADYADAQEKQFDTQFELQEYTVRTGFSPQPFKPDGRQRLPRADPRPQRGRRTSC